MNLKLPQEVLALGTTRNIMREIFEYGRKRAAEIGAENVFDFSLGNPSVPAPACVNDTVRALLSGQEAASIHAYTSAPGDLPNRVLLAKSLNRRFNAGARPDDLYFTTGAAAALTITFHALAVPGDEFIVFAPFFSEYSVFIEGAGAKTVVVPPDYETFEPDFTSLEAALNERTKGVVINTPNNPSGVVYSRTALERLSALLEQKQAQYGHPIFLITDEPYRELVFAGHETTWVPSLYENTVVCYSYSKSLSIPGERIGYIFLPQTVFMHDEVYACICGAARRLGFVNPPSLFQRVAALCDGETADLSIYERGAALLYDSLTEMGFHCIRPGGTFYLLMQSPVPDANDCAAKAREFDLLIVPTDSFCCPGYLRIALCVPTERIERALPAFKKLAQAYHLC